MPISAALISRGSTVLAEQCPPGNNFPAIARKLVEQIPSTPDSKKSYSYETYNFHYLVEGGITYICMTDQSMGYRVPYAFLFDVSNRFKATFGERIYTVGSMGLNDAFARVLQERIDYYSNDKTADKINKVKGEIEEAKNVMVKNIDKVLERGSKIEVLVDKTDILQEQAHSFKRKGTKLKRKMWWKNAKLCCILICILVVIIVGVTLGILYYTGVLNDVLGKHKKPNHDTTTTTGETSGPHTTAIVTTASLTTGGPPPLSTTGGDTETTTGIIRTTGVGTTGVHTTGTTAPPVTTAEATTAAPTTDAPTTAAPTTDVPTTEAPTTEAVTTGAITTGSTTADSTTTADATTSKSTTTDTTTAGAGTTGADGTTADATTDAGSTSVVTTGPTTAN